MTVHNRDWVAAISTNLLEITIGVSIVFSAGGAAGARPQINRPINSSATTESIFKFYSAKSIRSELSRRMVAFLGDLDVMRDLSFKNVLVSTSKNLHPRICQYSMLQLRGAVHVNKEQFDHSGRM